RAAQLGQTIGEGIVEGLLVCKKSEANTIEVGAGTAINQLGQLLQLDAPVTLRMIKPEEETADENAGLFKPCDETGQTLYFVNPGFYILTIRPASGYEGCIPYFEDTAFGVRHVSCLTKYVTEGLTFRLVKLVTPVPGTEAQKRNIVAHMCFGTADWADFGADLWAESGTDQKPFAQLGLNDLQLDPSLETCEVPVALMRWQSGSIEFIDNWAVRSACDRAQENVQIPLPFAGQKPSHSNVIFQQFHAHLAALKDTLSISEFHAIVGIHYFKYLPAAGLLPVGDTGVDPETFFGERTHGFPQIIPRQQWRSILNASVDEDPVVLSEIHSQPQPKDTIHIFYLQELLDAPESPFVLFATDSLVQRFHLPVHIYKEDDQTHYDSDDLEGIFQKTAEAYRTMLHAFATFTQSPPQPESVPAGTFSVAEAPSAVRLASNQFARMTNMVYFNMVNWYPVYNQDDLLARLFVRYYAGISAIEQILAQALKFNQEADAEVLNQSTAVTAFAALSKTQHHFAQTWDALLGSDISDHNSTNISALIFEIYHKIPGHRDAPLLQCLQNEVENADLFKLDKIQEEINSAIGTYFPVLPIGTLHVKFVTASPTTIPGTGHVDFDFQVSVNAQVDETYILTAQIWPVDQQGGWNPHMRWLIDSKPVNDASVQLNKIQSQDASLRITDAPPPGHSQIHLRFICESQKNPSQLYGFSTLIKLDAAGPIVLPDPAITLYFRSVAGYTQIDEKKYVRIIPNIDDGTMRDDGGGSLTFIVIFSQPGEYVVTPEIQCIRDNAWTPEQTLFTPDNSEVSQFFIAAEDIGQPHFIRIKMDVIDDAPDALLKLTVTNSEAGDQKTSLILPMQVW
ncbi:MAG: hypothetical protein DWQ10_14440, partial [Calditrichaeota bacterium]